MNFGNDRRTTDRLDLVLCGGELLDGTGSPGRRADIGVRGDRIVAVGDLSGARTARTIDAGGAVVAPGFIDIQSQSTFSLLADGDGESHVMQGITTEIIGEGGMPGMLTPRILSEDSRYRAWMDALGIEKDWDGFRGFLRRVERGGTAVNLGAFASIDLVRAEVMGQAARSPTTREIGKMREVVAGAMSEGAFGLAAALAYPPASFFSTDEIAAVAEPVADAGGIYISHVRAENAAVFEAITEAITIGAAANLPVVIFHLKVAGRPNWGKMPELCARIDGARARGARVSACQYPYAVAGTGLAAPVPDWAQEGGPDALVQRLRDTGARARIRADMETRDALLGRVDFEAIEVASVPPGVDDPAVGKRVAEIARERGLDPWDVYFGLLERTGANVFALYHSMSEQDVRHAMAMPWVSIASDAEATSPRGKLGAQRVHPRAYGTFPRVLGRYVREANVLSLAEAVRKMTSLPAAQVGLVDRGVVRPGAFADLVVFDPKTIRDAATFAQPHALAVGVRAVVTNGRVTVDDGRHTRVRAGRAIFGPGAARGGASR